MTGWNLLLLLLLLLLLTPPPPPPPLLLLLLLLLLLPPPPQTTHQYYSPTAPSHALFNYHKLPSILQRLKSTDCWVGGEHTPHPLSTKPTIHTISTHTPITIQHKPINCTSDISLYTHHSNCYQYIDICPEDGSFRPKHVVNKCLTHTHTHTIKNS